MELNYKEFGQGEPVIILHGLFGTLDNWQTMARQLAKKYTVFIVDQRNHGRSPHADEMDYNLMAEDLKQFMESKWIYETKIIGHSMGGKTAMQFAVNYPELVEQLVVVDIAPKPYVGNHQIIFKALEGLDLSKVTGRKEADANLAGMISDFGVRQFLLKNLTRKKTGGYEWKMNLPVIAKDYNNILAGIEGDSTFEGETLFIKGGKSNYIEAADLPLIQKYFPNSKLETITDSGHWVHAEAPAVLFELLSNFFH